MKKVARITSMVLVGAILSTSTIFASGKSRVPDKVIYTGIEKDKSGNVIHSPLYYDMGKDGLVGLKPSTLPDEVYQDPEYYFVNEIPYTLPVGQVKLSKLIGKDLGDKDVTLDVKKGKQRLTATINGKQLTSKVTEGITIKTEVGEFTDVPKNHYAYNDVKNAVANGWIKPESPTVFGLKKDVQGVHEIERGFSLSKQDVWYGLNALMLSNNIITENLTRSRGSTELWTKPGAKGDMYVEFPGNDLLYSLSFASNVAFYSGKPDLLFQVMGEDTGIYREVDGFLRGPAKSGYEYKDMARILQIFTHKMGLGVTNNLVGKNYIDFEYTITDNTIGSNVRDMSGATHYAVSRGLLNWNPELSMIGDRKGAIDRAQFAVILNRLDRAIKASGFGK